VLEIYQSLFQHTKRGDEVVIYALSYKLIIIHAFYPGRNPANRESKKRFIFKLNNLLPYKNVLG